MLRLFTGIRLPLPIREQLFLLRGSIYGARWTEMEDYHITLSFIGDIEEKSAEDIQKALSNIHVPQFKLSLKGTGCFARNDVPGHLWVGVEHNETLFRLREEIDHILEAQKIPVKIQPYTPHVTVASLKQGDEGKIAEFLQLHNIFTSAPFSVDEFILYRSHKGKEPPLYEEIKIYPLI